MLVSSLSVSQALEEVFVNSLLEHALQLYRLPLFELIDQAHQVHRQWRNPADIQRCVLLSIKTGGCPEDCGYCSQSAHHAANVPRQPLLTTEEVRTAAQRAKERGATRFCMGAAWRSAPCGEPFERVLGMVREVKSFGLEACACFKSERLDFSYHAEHSFERLTAGSASPRSSHAEAGCSTFLGALRRRSDFFGRKEWLARYIGCVVGRLRAIAAILRAATGLDGEQHAALYVGGITPLPMHLMRLIDQFKKRKAIELERMLEKRIHEYLFQSLGHG